MCSTGGLKCEQNAYPIWFSGLSDIRSGMVWTWCRASFQETIEIFTVAHNCHGKLKFTTASSNSRRQIQIRWPTTVTANKICHGKVKFAMANSYSLWKIKIYHGKSTRWSRGKMGVLNNARVGKDRRATARFGFCRHRFSVNCEIFTLSLLQVEMN